MKRFRILQLASSFSLLIATISLFGTQSVQAQENQSLPTVTVLHSFPHVTPGVGEDPSALIMDGKGNLYGTTFQGCGEITSSPPECVTFMGVVFKIDAGGAFTVFYSFPETASNGAHPGPQGLLMDSSGNLFGTTEFGGATGSGTIFRLDTSGTQTVLHNFAGSDGATPNAGLIMDSKGTLYGTTATGGASDKGTIFALATGGTLTVLHSFNGADGAVPSSGLFMDNNGNLFGTTQSGGASDKGSVFKLDTTGALTVLHSFTGTEGASPRCRLIIDDKGNLYGTTARGGASDLGTVFKLDPGNTLTMLHSFGGADGAFPFEGLIVDGKGNFYGTTGKGGASDNGTVFKLDAAGTLSVIHSFAGSPADGAEPHQRLLLDNNGNLYGTTALGGALFGGTVFKLTFPAAPAAPGIVVTDSVSPANDLQIPFGNVTPGGASDQTVTITNSGNADLLIGTIAAANPLAPPFSIPSDNCTAKTIKSGTSCSLTVRFAPTGPGTFSDSFDIPSNDPNKPTVTMSVSGTGLSGGTPGAPAIVVTDSVPPDNDLQMPFGNLTEGRTSDQTVTIGNTGSADLVIGTIAGANPLAAPFNIQSDSCSGKTVKTGTNCTLTVRFAPTGTGTFSDSFDIPSNDPKNPTVTMSVSGTGLSSAVNNPPSAPALVFPENGQTGLGTTVTFIWKKSTDPDGDPVSYRLFTCTDQSFAGCSPVTVGDKTAAYAGFGFAGLSLLGLISIRRKGTVGFMLLVVVLASGIIFSCGHDGGGGGGGTNPPPPVTADEVSFQVSNLNPGTTYFWKVAADDGKGGTAESEVRNFTTQ